LEHNIIRTLVINVIKPYVNLEDNEILTAPFQIQEFKEAMFSMHLDKCPGPDGFNP